VFSTGLCALKDKDTLDLSTTLSFCATSIDSFVQFTLNSLILELTFVLLCAMLFQRFAPAAAAFNSALYVTGGYDGNMYLQYDP
jgi:flagellar biogenesis protein FliO